MHYTICVNFEAKIEAGAGPKSRLRLQPNTPAPAPILCFLVVTSVGYGPLRLHFSMNHFICRRLKFKI